ncbi:MAG: hypothetical protein HYV07_30525 [Deltaproteobacteria bacterium]|nr:hypothetical protein [Deltaproteobacteria bacterium]
MTRALAVCILAASCSNSIVLAPAVSSSGTAVYLAVSELGEIREAWVVDLASGSGDECRPMIDDPNERVLAVRFDARPDDLCLAPGCLEVEPGGEPLGEGAEVFELVHHNVSPRWVPLSSDHSELGALRVPPCDRAPSPVAELTLGGLHTCARLEDGRVFCWGAGQTGQLGDHVDWTSSPRLVSLDGAARDLASGARHTCALVSEALWCWGDDALGQIGATDRDAHFLPVRGLDPGLGVDAVAAGWAHTCVQLADGRVTCWGSNEASQLGGAPGQGSTVFPPGVEGAAQLSLGKIHSLALMPDGRLMGWGGNPYGQLVDGTTESRAEPRAAPFEAPIEAISAGEQHTCVLAGGSVYCGGYNNHGQSSATPGSIFTLSPMRGGERASLVVAGGRMTCWVEAGVPSCVGEAFAEHEAIERLEDVGLVSIGQTEMQNGEIVHACAVSSGRTIWCWGPNGHGQLGDGTNESRSAPVKVVWPR